MRLSIVPLASRAARRSWVFPTDPLSCSVFSGLITRMYCAYFSIPRLASDNTWRRWYNAPGCRAIHLRPDNVGSIRASLWFISKPAGYEGFSLVEQKQLLHDKFSNAGWEAARVLEGLAKADDMYFDHLTQVHASHWSSGRAGIVGDCAYGPSPLSGMGTAFAIVGAYVLAGELARHSEPRRGFEEYEKLMRPYVKLAQNIPPGVPRIANPRTRLGIWVLHKLAKLVSSRTLKHDENGPGSSPADKTELPDYAAEIADSASY